VNTSLFELFKIGIGPSSSHTVGPMRASLRFARELAAAGNLDRTHHVVVDLYGSLALTGIGHGTDRAILLGLSGEAPDTVDPSTIDANIAAIRSTEQLALLGRHPIRFRESEHLRFHRNTMYPIAARPAPSLTPIPEDQIPPTLNTPTPGDSPANMEPATSPATHPNGLRLSAFDRDNNLLASDIFYSVGGGFIVSQAEFHPEAPIATSSRSVPYPFRSAQQLLARAEQHQLTVAELVLANEVALLSDPTISRPNLCQPSRSGESALLPSPSENHAEAPFSGPAPQQQIEDSILALWHTMQISTDRGLATEGILPGGLNVRRRAPRLSQKLNTRGSRDPLAPMDWVTVYAMAVNEENAAGGRVVTAPTNGAAGVIPAIAHFYMRFIDPLTGEALPSTPHSSRATDSDPDVVRLRSTPSHDTSPDAAAAAQRAGLLRYFLTAAAIGILYKENASISGAEVGCQGEVGVACSMAAGGLVAALNGSNAQIEHAAEIAMEHNLGMTCDPIGGLVQIPCIERNGMGAVKAINAARLAIADTETHKLSLDQIIETMYRTGMDMQSRYKETSLAGLALNIIEC